MNIQFNLLLKKYYYPSRLPMFTFEILLIQLLALLVWKEGYKKKKIVWIIH